MSRVISIDATRGFIMFIMIFVNDLGLISNNLLPDWMVHFSDRATGSGMTFVDWVFPGFIFIVGMSIPFAIENNFKKGLSYTQIYQHIFVRTLSLWVLGLLMRNGWPGSTLLGWSPALWQTIMLLFAMLAFCEIAPLKKTIYQHFLNTLGWLGLMFMAWQYVSKHGEPLFTLHPFFINTHTWGILGIIGWAYALACIIYLLFKNHQTALLASMGLFICVFAADKSHMFSSLGLDHYINIAEEWGSCPAIAVAGMFLSTTIFSNLSDRIQFTGLFIVGMFLSGWMLSGTWGVSKNIATPSWALFSCASTAGLWILINLIQIKRPLKPLILSGQNVIFSYLLSSIYYPFMILIGLRDAYQDFGQMDLFHAILRAILISLTILSLTVFFNQKGLRLKL